MSGLEPNGDPLQPGGRQLGGRQPACAVGSWYLSAKSSLYLCGRVPERVAPRSEGLEWVGKTSKQSHCAGPGTGGSSEDR